MELTQTRTIAAPLPAVWGALNDPDVLKACIPGCESFERVGDNAYKAVVAAKVGPVSARFTGRMELADVTPPTSYTLKFDGQGGAAGFASGSAHVSLADGGNGATALTYSAKAQVGGKLAQIGNRLVDGAAAKLADDFFARFAQRMAPPAPAAAEAVEAAAPPSGQAAPAPAPWPTGTRWVRYAAIVLMAVVIVWLYLRGRH